MNDPNPNALDALRNAKAAYNNGMHLEARKYASVAIQNNPNLEDAWLILAAISTPQASIAYLKTALEINPSSSQAQKGLKWAYQRLNGLETDTSVPSIPEPSINPNAVALPPSKTGERLARRKPEKSKSLIRSPLFWILTIIIIVSLFCVSVIVWLFTPNNSVVLAENYSQEQPSGILEKPTLTPTSTATNSPTPTNTPTATATGTPTVTETLIATGTAMATLTQTPVPTTEILEPNREYSNSSSEWLPEDMDDGERWIEVDLGSQSLTAYEGENIVQTFIVSTGLPGTPTVTGQYYVYAKYSSVLMSGPGYHLPDVPYTMYFYKNYALHGTYWHNNFGTPMSHGCVNLANPDAEWLYGWTGVGTPVIIHD